MTRTRVGAALAITLLVLASGCTGEGESGAPEPNRDPVALDLETVSGADGLDGRARAAAEEAIGGALTEFVVGGFLGDYPRRDFVRAFDSFSSGLVVLAAEDIDVLTGARYGDAESVRAVRLDADLSLLARDGRVIGATAAVRLAFEATLPDGTVDPFGLRGRLVLANEGGTWSTFAYDVQRDDGSRVEGEVS